PSIREQISTVLGRTGAFAALGAFVACMLLTIVLSYGTAASSRAQGIAHASGVASRQESAKADEADARATVKRFANVPPTETLL
ncbi:hypothetical protein, partial [Streptomyces scabiei]|uniref:hypothetical protein n=1 Tax=Streptomyces scabiei TaxID=1930 RepID=UPI0038F6A012